jgi:hypothetical protein
MKTKLLSGAAAIALIACTILATSAPASAAPWGWHRGWGGGWGWGGAVGAGLIGGAFAAATSPLWASGYYDYDPGYAYAPGYGYGYSGYYDYDPGYAFGPGYDTGYGYGPDYGYAGYSYAPAPAVAAGPMVAQNGGDATYCQQRFRSYDPSTGTYLGFDGKRHPCP